MTCEPCRHNLLPFLYDLLEPLERETMAAHLEGCPECQAALTQARDQQGLLVEAVKQEHADIVFKAPTRATPASTVPTVVMQRPPRRLFLLNRWAAAASIRAWPVKRFSPWPSSRSSRFARRQRSHCNPACFPSVGAPFAAPPRTTRQ